MSVTYIPQIYNDIVMDKFPEYGSLFGNGLVYNDPAPPFTKGGEFLYSPKLSSLASLGDDNKRNTTGDISSKTLSSSQSKAVIIRRYDSMIQTDYTNVTSGLDGIKMLTPQVAQAINKTYEMRYGYILKGLFAYGGALTSTNGYNYTASGTAGAIDSDAIISARMLLGADSAKLTTCIVHSHVYTKLLQSNLVLKDSVLTAQGQQIANTAQLGGLLGMKYVIDDNLCAPIANNLTGAAATGTVTRSTTTVGSVTVTSGGGYYTSAPAVTFSGGGGTGAAGTAVLTDGVVTSVTITNAGTGYSSDPTVTFAGTGSIFYPSYMIGGKPFYFANQRAMNMRFISNDMAQNVTQILRWDLDYCPHVINTNFVPTDPNPDNDVLQLAATWTSTANEVSDIPIVRLLTR